MNLDFQPVQIHKLSSAVGMITTGAQIFGIMALLPDTRTMVPILDINNHLWLKIAPSNSVSGVHIGETARRWYQDSKQTKLLFIVACESIEKEAHKYQSLMETDIFEFQDSQLFLNLEMVSANLHTISTYETVLSQDEYTEMCLKHIAAGTMAMNVFSIKDARKQHTFLVPEVFV